MKKHGIILTTVAALVAGYVVADFCRSGEPRGIRFPYLKILLTQNDRHGWEIKEDAALFAAHFATVHYDEYHLNYAEQKQLAVAIAQSIAGYYGSTNDIRIVHWEQPEPASTNFADQVSAWLQGKYTTDEIVPATKQKGVAK